MSLDIAHCQRCLEEESACIATQLSHVLARLLPPATTLHLAACEVDDAAAQLTGSLSAIALTEKRYADGEALARQAEAGFAKSSSAGMEAATLALGARNLLGANDLSGAQAAVAKANTLLRQSTLMPSLPPWPARIPSISIGKNPSST